MESITIKVDNDLVGEIKKAMKPRYATKSEFIRDAIRTKLEELDLKRRKEGLDRMQGILKGKIKRLTHEEREKNAYELLEEKKRGVDIFKKYGL